MENENGCNMFVYTQSSWVTDYVSILVHMPSDVDGSMNKFFPCHFSISGSFKLFAYKVHVLPFWLMLQTVKLQIEVQRGQNQLL